MTALYIVAAILLGIAIGCPFGYFICVLIKRNEPHKAETARLKAHRKRFENG
jgi:hypothetical protein